MRYRFGSCAIDTDRFELTRDGVRVEVEPQALDLLIHLVQRRERLVTKEELHRDFWGGRFVSDSALSTLIKAARRAVGDSGRAQDVIETEHGRGFRFRAAVTIEDARAGPPAADTAPPPAPPGRASPETEAPAIAVLPFDNLSRDPAHHAFVDGVTEEVITGLSRFRWFTVVSRETALGIRGAGQDVRAIGAALGVDYLVAGSVLREGDRARVHAELSDAASGLSIWARRYDVGFGSLFGAIDEIAEQVVGAIQPELLESEARRGARAAPADQTAWLLFVRAHLLLAGPARATNAEARRLLLEADAREPGSARVLASLALTHLWDVFYGWSGDPGASLRAAYETAARAVELGAESYAWTAVGSCRLLLRDHDGALADHDRAVALNPSSPLAHGTRALALAFAGEAEAALAAAARADRLSPDDPRAAIWRNAESLAAFALGDFVRALAAGRAVTALRPDYPAGWRLVAAGAAALGRGQLAAEAAARLLELQPDHRIAGALAALPFRRAEDAAAYGRALAAAGLA